MLRLASLALVALGCGHTAHTNVGSRPPARSSLEQRSLASALRPAPRLGPFAGAGSGVRRVDVAQR